MRRLRTAALALLMLIPPAAGQAQSRLSDAARREKACQLAIEIVAEREAHSKSRRFVLPAKTSGRLPASVAEFRRGWDKAVPSAGVLATALAQGSVAAIKACPSLRAHLDDRGVAYGDEAEAARWDRKYPLTANADALYLALPAISADGREAVVDVGLSCGSLCGSGMFRYYRRTTSGKWSLVGSSRWWLS